MNKVNVFWFRRDLRLSDNTGLCHALNENLPLVPIFIFDTDILSDLSKNDPRITFIYQQLAEIHIELRKYKSSINIYHGTPKDVWEKLAKEFEINSVFYNKDYEPYALARDKMVNTILYKKGIKVHSYKDQVIFEENEICKEDGTPYTVYTPYMKKWRKAFEHISLEIPKLKTENFYTQTKELPSLSSIGFEKSDIKVKDYQIAHLDKYKDTRNSPSEDATSYLSPHLRFGTVGIRELIKKIPSNNYTFTNELIWRSFFMQILFHFPRVVNHNFRTKYDGIKWRNNQEEFDRWCVGETGYPMVDAGMRQLNKTGYMHNRVRMIAASFLCKHLLVDWRWGEAYFAQKLLDYELSSNNGNWQWAAGTGCDAAPYFRIFNPYEQTRKFDRQNIYIKKWVPEFERPDYKPIVEHKFARERALKTYKEGIQ
jgi:deoxyribodipyrimidine photo-lyase